MAAIFPYGSMWGKIKELDSWVRHRLRLCIWHDWKKPEQGGALRKCPVDIFSERASLKGRKNLMCLGVDKRHAYLWSRSRMGRWAVAQSPILKTTITLERLQKRGYESMLDYYYKIAPHYSGFNAVGILF